jgi:mono/diheme cytochrome c family protein
MNWTPASRGRVRPAALLAGAAAAALLLAGCGSVGHSEGTGDRGKGKVLFTQKCGSCHTLADAGTQGQIGPNLDYAFLQSRRDGLGESTFVQVVRGQIAYPITSPSTGAPGMPANLVEGQDADDVASYVAAVAGTGAAAPSTTAPATTQPATTQPATTEPATTTSGSEAAAGDAAAGKAVFTSAGCVGCHTLADAGATGTVGPNLDDAKPSADLVTERVTNGKGAMPPFKGQLSDTQIADVAAYVSSVAGK